MRGQRVKSLLLMLFLLTFSGSLYAENLYKIQSKPYNYNTLISTGKSHVALTALIDWLDVFEKMFLNIDREASPSETETLLQIQSHMNEAILNEISAFSHSLRMYIKKQAWDEESTKEIQKAIDYLLNPKIRMSFESKSYLSTVTANTASATAIKGFLKKIKSLLKEKGGLKESSFDSSFAATLTLRNLSRWIVESSKIAKDFKHSQSETNEHSKLQMDVSHTYLGQIKKMSDWIQLYKSEINFNNEKNKNQQLMDLLLALDMYSKELSQMEKNLEFELANHEGDEQQSQIGKKLKALVHYFTFSTLHSQKSATIIDAELIYLFSNPCNVALE